MSVRLDGAFAEELLRCRDVEWYLDRRYFRIAGKVRESAAGGVGPLGGVEVPIVLFDPRPEQVAIRRLKYAHRNVYNLKARQLGFSTEEGCDKLGKCMMNGYWTHGVVAHTEDAAAAIFQKVYVDVYDRLPGAMKKAFPLVKCNDGQMRFKNGSEIVITTADSPSFAGRTFTSVHYSEFARYKDPDKVFSDIVVSPKGFQYLETTAEGYNRAYDYWVEDNGFHKVFMSWVLCPDYVSDVRPERLREDVEVYALKHNLDIRQKWWMYGELSRVNWNWSKFNQKYPASPELAFVSSGERYFQKSWENPHVHEGRIRKEPVKAGHTYVMGVDTAGGSRQGDFSAYVVLDVTDVERPRIVSTAYMRLKPTDFAFHVLDEAMHYGAVINPENNGGYGMAMIEAVLGSGYSRVYRQQVPGKVAGTFESRWGYNNNASTRGVLISALDRIVDQPWFDIWDTRLQSEIVKFATIEGKEQASPGGHDDMLIALALALVAIDQRVVEDVYLQSHRPRTPAEHMLFLQRNGRVVNGDDQFDDDEASDATDGMIGITQLSQQFRL